MRLLKVLFATFIFFASVYNANGQISSENLVGIHNLNSTQISGLVSPIKGSLVFNTDSNRLFVFDGTIWVATATVDTSSLSNRINQRVRYADTASMLSPYLRSALGVKYTDTASMLVNYINSASNGLNQSGKDVRLGGNLTAATTITNNSNALTIATGGSALNVTGLTAGAATDSLLTINTTTGRVNRVAPSLLNKVDSTTASNGITLSGKDVRLGGNLTGATSITTTGVNTLALGGLQSGTTNDSLVVADASTGILKRVSSNRLASGWSLTGNGGTTAGTNFIGTTDGIDLVFKVNSVESGRLNLYNLSTSYGYSSIAAYKSTAIGYGASTGANTESVTIGNASSSVYRSVSVGSEAVSTGNNSIALGQAATAAFQGTALGSTASATGNNSTAIGFGATTSQANALILGNSSAQVGIGTSTPGYALDVNATSNPLKLSGLVSGALTDSLMTINTSNGVVRRIAASQLNKVDSTTASNGITLTGKDVRLGGNLTAATTITNNSNTLTIATGGSALNVTGLTAGAATDSLLTINTATGRVNRVAPSLLNKVDSTTASNGITLTGKDVRLGGNLTAATTITNNSNTLTIATGGSALNVTGLTAGAATDSVLTINTATGRVNRVAPSLLNKADSTTASNGITLSGKDVRLGGTLTGATTITTDATNTLLLSGLQSATLNDSVVMISSGNVLRRINSTSLALEPFNVLGGTTKASTNTQNIYTQGDLSVGKSTSTATLDVGGKIKADSNISAPNFSSTYQNFGSAGGTINWNMQSGATAGIRLTSNGTLSITNVTAGMYGLIRVTQDGTGGRTLALPSGSRVINGGSGAVTLTQTANAVDILTFFYDGTNYWWTIGNNYN